MIADFKTYAKSANSAQTSNKFYFDMTSVFTAPNAPVVQVLGILGTNNGINIGTCNNLYFNWFLHIVQGKAGGATSFLETKFGYLPFDSKAVGFTIWAQSAWADSKTNGFRLTQAISFKVPVQPPSMTPRTVLYDYRPANRTALSMSNSQYWNPVVQYSAK